MEPQRKWNPKSCIKWKSDAPIVEEPTVQRIKYSILYCHFHLAHWNLSPGPKHREGFFYGYICYNHLVLLRGQHVVIGIWPKATAFIWPLLSRVDLLFTLPTGEGRHRYQHKDWQSLDSRVRWDHCCVCTYYLRWNDTTDRNVAFCLKQSLLLFTLSP